LCSQHHFRNNFDDTEESILNRISTYNEKTKTVATKHNATVISAERQAEEIFVDIQGVMDKL
jgi:adenylate kinase family enzyme